MDRSTATIQYVRVDHRGLDVLVPRQLLQKSSANVSAARPPEIPGLAAGYQKLKRFSDLRVNNFPVHRTMPVSGCVFGNPLDWLVIGRANPRYVWNSRGRNRPVRFMYSL